MAPPPGPPHVNPDQVLARSRTKAYPHQVWFFLASFIFLATVANVLSILYRRIARRRISPTAVADPEKSGETAPARHGSSLRRLPSAIANLYRVVAYRWTLEIGQSYTLNLAEVFVTIAYIIVIFGWEFINTTDTAGNKLSLSYWSNRAGAIAISQVPIITALGTKNNIVSLLTGVSFDKINYVHRMMARVVLLLLWVHGGSKLNAFSAEGMIEEALSAMFIRCGLMALCAFSFLFLVSLRPVRAAAYEFFLYLHFATVLIFLVGAYFHVKKLMYDPYVYTAFIIWGLDRLIRFVRLVLFNHSYFGLGKSDHFDATTELLSDHFVRLRFNRPPHFHWTPGQTAYLILPGVSKLPFEAHPFTIASFDSPSSQSEKSTPSASSSANQLENPGESAAPYWKELVFLINVRGGFTKHLAETARRGGTVKVLVDGPYGTSPDLSRFDTSVLIAGGTGVSYTLPTLLDIVERARNGATLCRKVVFIWTIRDASHIRWISEALSRALELAPESLKIELRIFVTGAGGMNGVEELRNYSTSWDADSVHSGSRSNMELDKLKSAHILDSPAAKVSEGRPDLHTILREEADATNGKMSVSVCGSQPIARTVRNALRFPVSSPGNILRGAPSVTLHVESFGYA